MTETQNEAVLALVLQDSGLDNTKKELLTRQFAGYYAIAEQWKLESASLLVTSEDQTELMKRARQGRLVLKDKRVQIEKTRKELKDASLQEGRAIDSVAKLLTSLIEPTEQFLLQQEEFSKRAEQARQKQHQELIATRRRIINQYGAEISDEKLSDMTIATFIAFADSARDLWLREIKTLEAEREAQRKADQRSREDLLDTVHRLQREQDEKDKQAAAERRQQEAEQQKLRNEAQGLRDAEAKRKRDQEEQQRQTRLQAAALAAGPDKQKLVALADRIYQLNLGLTSDLVQGEKARTIVASVDSTLDKIQHWLREQAETL